MLVCCVNFEIFLGSLEPWADLIPSRADSMATALICCCLSPDRKKNPSAAERNSEDYVTEIQECVLSLMRGEQTGTCIYHELLKADKILMVEKQNHVC